VSEPPPRNSRISDYVKVVGINSLGRMPLVVGGQAANAWAITYASKLGSKLAKYRPFTSKDLDLAGDRQLLEDICRITKGTLHYSEPRSPVVGCVETWVGNDTRRIEVLRNVRGLSQKDLSDSVELTIDQTRVRVLAPIKLLKAKICNAVTLDQKERNDLNHVRIMIECVREFVRDILLGVASGHIAQRQLVNLLEELRDVVTSPLSKKACEMWGFDFGKVWPRGDLESCRLQKIERFVQHRLTFLD